MSGGHGYTYTSIVVRPGEPTDIGVSFYLDDHAWVTVAGAGTDRPHLHIAQGEVSVSIGPRTETVTADDVVIARRLADQAAEYAAEMQRLSEEQQPGSPGTTAA
jgi:hypothetical protein